MAISTRSDVIKYARVDKEFPKCDIEEIDEIEWKEFNDRLGLDLLPILEADLADLSNVQAWDDSTQYATGDITSHAGHNWIATSEPEPDLGKAPDGEANQWRIITKFKTECYDDAWCKGLARYLALSVIVQSIVPNAQELTAMGVVIKYGDNFNAASTSRVKALENHYYSADRDWETIDWTITDKAK